MGGIGSGQWYRWSTKPLVEDGLTLDLARLMRQGLVRPGAFVSGTIYWHTAGTGERIASISYEANLQYPPGGWIRLHYTNNDEPFDYRVPLTTTRPNFGGWRWWFQCPVHHERVAKLYKPVGATVFASRSAYRLAYRSQNATLHDRLAEKSHRIRRRLGGEPGFDQPHPRKPKGMHWRTYGRLCEEMDLYEDASWKTAAAAFGCRF